VVLLCCWLLGWGIAGCGPSADERGTARRNLPPEAEWAWLQQTKQKLDGEREKLTGGTQDRSLARSIDALAAELDRRLVEFINADPPVQGDSLTDRQRAAIRMKSDEDVRLARQFIAHGGDYQRAIDIYKEALLVDPGNARLRAELAQAEARQYMTQKAFLQVKEGMDQEEVRHLLGQPNLHNVRNYPDRHVVGWFYPKDRSGAAAAVWFQDDGGRLTVYLFDFDALQPRSPAAPAEPPAAPNQST